jgi:hypothetical protein
MTYLFHDGVENFTTKEIAGNGQFAVYEADV